MRLTARDQRLSRDIALSHVLSRDQVIDLGYFASVTRANTRLRELCLIGVVRRLETPFYAQSLYGIGPKAAPVLGAQIGPIVAGRRGSPQFLQHALCTTNVRIALLMRGANAWRFEQQLRASFSYCGREWEVRPDGLAVGSKLPTAVEVDLGHVASVKFKDKLRAYDAYVASGEIRQHWRIERFRLLVVTTGAIRAKRLARLMPRDASFDCRFATFADLSIPAVGGWS